TMSEHAAEFEVHIAARPETVFSLFVDQAAFAQWMGAQMGVATIEPRVGGSVRVDYGGGWKIASGEIVELAAPERFSFTWGYEDGQPFAVGSTRVDITLAATDTGTRLTLRHSGLPSEVAAREHGSGWRLYTGILAHIAAAQRHMQGLVIEAAGAVEQVHQHVRVPWRVTKDGETMFTGANVATIGPDGRFTSVVGFTDS
ncbi:MAG: SRPBCC domain-containing protein, partial [Gemmatimonadetes bacterium]|nr:SRPBCC domain-containing protein [Gemmatimonadota bacterium]